MKAVNFIIIFIVIIIFILVGTAYIISHAASTQIKTSTSASKQCKFYVKFYNDTEMTLTVSLEWEDHPYKFPFAFGVAMGDIHSGESWLLQESHPCGIYSYKWFNKQNDLYYFSGFKQTPQNESPRIIKPPEEWK
jgi:hypothetical protein